MALQTEKRGGRSGPRPRGPFADKRKTLTTRITENTRLRLEEAAAETGRSLSQEIELRLQRSFDVEQRVEDIRRTTREMVYESFGGNDSYEFCRYLAIMANLLTSGLDRSCKDDSTVFQFVVGAWTTLVRVQAELPVDLDRKGGKPAETGARLLDKLAGGPSDDQREREMRESGDRAVREILSILIREKHVEPSGGGKG